LPDLYAASSRPKAALSCVRTAWALAGGADAGGGGGDDVFGGGVVGAEVVGDGDWFGDVEVWPVTIEAPGGP
jgi:hypothetical protein